MTDYAVTIVLGYVMGSLPWGLIVGYLWLRRDIRDSGSGKTGTTNVRGVASTYGGVLGLAPLVSLGFPVIGAVLVIATRYVSVMSVVGVPLCAALMAVAAAFGWTEWVYVVFAVFATALVEYKHIPNIKRLLDGAAPKIGQGGGSPATG